MAPSTQKLSRVQTLRQRLLYFGEHGFAGARTVGLAQTLGLIDSDPEDSKRWPATDVIFQQILETGLEIKAPLYIQEGERVKVYTESGEFAGRA